MGSPYWKGERDAQPWGTPEYWDADRRVRNAEEEERRQRALNGTYGSGDTKLLDCRPCLFYIVLFVVLFIFVLVAFSWH